MTPTPRILIVDDEPGTIKVLEKSLEGMGELLTATSGARALAQLAEHSVDLVLLDLIMPEMDGFATCLAIRQDHPHLPVIFVTVANDTASEIRALEVGGHDFISKPVNPPVVRARVALQLKLQSELAERLRAEGQLSLSEERLRLVLDSARMGTFHWSLTTGEIVWSHNCLKLFGLPLANAGSYEGWLACLYPEDREIFDRRCRQSMAMHSDFDSEYRILQPDGTQRWQAAKGRFFYGADGTPQRMEGVVSDISERRAMEEEIRTLNTNLERKVAERTAELVVAQAQLHEVLGCVARSETRYRIMFEQAPLGVVLVESSNDAVESQAGLIVEANQHFATIIGRPLEELLGNNWINITHPDDVQAGLDLRARLKAGDLDGFHMRKRYLRPDGSFVWANLTLVPVVVGADEPPRHLCMVEDITEHKRLESALSASEDRYRLALEATHEALWDCDLVTGTFIVNDQADALLGYTHGEVTHSFDLWKHHCHPSDAATVLRANVDYLSGRTPSLDLEYRIITKSGELRWLRTVGKIVARDAEGRPTRIVGTSEDITDKVRGQLEIKAGMQRLQLATMAADLGIWVWDMATGTLEWDERMCNWYEVPEDLRAKGLHADFWASCVHPDDLERTQNKLQEAIRRRTPFEDIFRIRLPGDRVRYIHATGLVEQDAEGRPQRVLGINRDITTQREQEEALWTAKQAAEAANVAKTAFLAHMSHEIRTPMNAVLGLAQVLEKTALDPDQRTMVQQVRTAGRSLLGILNDILDLSKIEAGRLELEARPFALATLLTGIENLLEPTARAKGIGLTVAAPPPLDGGLLGDPLRLEQVLVNLIGNAIKFTEQGEVRVRIEPLVMTESNVRLRFEVSDTGIGMPPEALAGLFTPFTQSDSSITRRFGGTGLGLSICKRLVELLGGEIGVESRHGEGSTFWFELSCARTAAAQPLPPAPPLVKATGGPHLAGLHILVVDDGAINREVVERALALEGAITTQAANGQQALQLLKSSPTAFDAVLMDVQMPIMDGLTASRAIRGELGLTELPVIALTAGVLPEQQVAARAAGVNDVIAKPVDLERMRDCLLQWIRPLEQPLVERHTRDDNASASRLGADPTGSVEENRHTPTLTDWPDIPGIDRSRTLQTCGQDLAFFRRLLERFADEFAHVVEQIRLDLTTNDRQSATRRMHTLRGTAGYLGALDLMQTAVGLEQAIAAHEIGLDEQLMTLGDQVDAIITASIPFVNMMVAPPSVKTPVKTDTAPPLDPYRYEALRSALRFQKGTARRLFKELEPAISDVLGVTDTQTLGRAIRDLRFEEALAILDRTTTDT